ncbi:MAG: hypothetical protein ABI472_00045 [Ginsengibacter sp.]
MKKIIFFSLALCLYLIACDSKKEDTTATTTASTVSLPYTASYSTEFNNNVSDSDLLTVLNSYKAWENGDMKALRATLDDSSYVDGADGFKFRGLTDSLMTEWTKHRDSISSVKITMDVWLKSHAVKDGANFINVWYKEIDTYKNGKVDSANFEDDNGMKNGKIIWYSSHRQTLK